MYQVNLERATGSGLINPVYNAEKHLFCYSPEA